MIRKKKGEGFFEDYSIIKESVDNVLKVNYLKTPRIPSIEEDPLCMAKTCELLASNPSITKIVFTQKHDFEYEYDETDRLVREVRFDDAGDTVYGLAYSYDGVGNRLLQEDLVTGDTTGYSYGADNRMLSAGDYDIEKMC